MSTTHRPVTVRLSQAVLERLDRSMVLSGDDSHSAAVRRLLLLALDHEQKLSAPLDDRIVDLIQTRVAVPKEEIARFEAATKDAVTAAVAVHRHSDALHSLSFWLRTDLHSLATKFGLALGSGLVLGAVAGICAVFLLASV